MKWQASLHTDSNLVLKVRELWTHNMNSSNLLRCLLLHGWDLSSTQLRNLCLHSSLRLLMGTANGEDAKFEANIRAEHLVREQLISGQSIT